MFDPILRRRSRTTPDLNVRRSYAVNPAWLTIALLVPLIAVGLVACETAETTAKGPADPLDELLPAPESAPAAANAGPSGELTVTGDTEADADAFAARLEQATANQPVAEVDWDSPQGVIVEARRPVATNPSLQPIQPQPSQRLDQPVEPEPAPQPVVTPEPVVVTKPAPPLTRQQLIDKLAEHLRLEAGRGELRAPLAAAALSLADPKRELTADDLAALDKDERRLILAYQRAFTQLARSLGESSTADRQQLQLTAEELAEEVGAEKRLRLRSAKLCRKVTGYGQYVAFPSTTFLAGSEHPVIVYAEVDHFQPKAQPDGSYQVRLNQEISLYNESDGLKVWNVKPQQIVDQSANRRRDFFVVQVVRLPNRLTVGKYLMKLTVTDEVGQQIDEATIPVHIVADPNQLAGQ